MRSGVGLVEGKVQIEVNLMIRPFSQLAVKEK
jgi:hypothetical protein